MMALTRFWPTLECVATVSTVAAQWRMLLGMEYDPTWPFFHPLKELSLCYMRPDPTQFPYRIEIRTPSRIIGICDETGEEIELTTADLVLYELDRPAFCRAVAQALGVAGTPTPVENGSWTERLGYYVPVGGHRFPAFLSICCRDSDFQQVASRLVSTEREPFLLFAPTCRHFTPPVQLMMRQSNAGLIPLGDALLLDRGQRLTATSTAAAMLEAFVDMAIARDHIHRTVTHVNEFHRLGAVWQIRFRGKTICLNNIKGLAYLAQMIAHPGQQVHCASMVATLSGMQDRVALGSSGANLDPEALAKYRSEILELKEELAQSQRNRDYGRQEEIQADLDRLTAEITGALGLHGRRRGCADVNRLRVAVTVDIRRAVAKINALHPALGDHLKRTVRTGTHLSYSPDHDVEWFV